jgi:hypothetical protein
MVLISDQEELQEVNALTELIITKTTLYKPGHDVVLKKSLISINFHIEYFKIKRPLIIHHSKLI